MYTIQIPLRVRIALALVIFSVASGCTKHIDIIARAQQPSDTIPEIHKSWQVSTVAGSGVQGAADGPDSIASFHYPAFLALDTAENIFVSDVLNFAIRKVSHGQVSTYTTRGMSQTAIDFKNIYGLVVDQQNNIYDVEYSMIRKVTSPTENTIFAGNLGIWFKDGLDTAARFNQISRVATDHFGNLYVPDYDMHATFYIRKITPQAVVTTLTLTDSTGLASGSDSMHYYLSSIAVDDAGNIYFTANGNQVIKKADPQGNVTRFAGANDIGFIDGTGMDAKFYGISALRTDHQGNLYVADAGNHAIRKVTPDGTVTTLAGRAGPGFQDGDAAGAQFFFPSDIAIAKNGTIYIADSGNNRIRKLEYK